VRIHRLTTGRVRGPRRSRGALRYVRLEWSDEALVVNAFLIEHPRGLLLVDAGQGAAAAVPGYLPRWHPFLRIARFELTQDDEVAARIRDLGFRPDDVRSIVLTHLHTDHVGGLSGFSAATEVVVARAEWQRATGLRGALRGYVPKQWPSRLEPHLVELDGPPLGPFGASLDLLGDGTVHLVPLPGHTPGQIGVLVHGAERDALVGGDVAHDRRELAAVAPELDAYCTRGGVLFLAAHDDALPALVTV
jgi:N-acyl homoserine lactone hydrolase